MTTETQVFNTKTQSIGLLVWLVVCFSASAVGAVASINAPSFYADLTQPAWSPPAWLFGPVWSVLYAMMAVAAWLVWRRGGFKHLGGVLTLFLAQLVLNGLWSWLFFGWQLGLMSFINIMILWVSILLTLIGFWRIDKWAGVMLLPYLFWVSFASVLNYTMWQLNPQILG